MTIYLHPTTRLFIHSSHIWRYTSTLFICKYHVWRYAFILRPYFSSLNVIYDDMPSSFYHTFHIKSSYVTTYHHPYNTVPFIHERHIWQHTSILLPRFSSLDDTYMAICLHPSTILFINKCHTRRYAFILLPNFPSLNDRHIRPKIDLVHQNHWIHSRD